MIFILGLLAWPADNSGLAFNFSFLKGELLTKKKKKSLTFKPPNPYLPLLLVVANPTRIGYVPN